MHEDAILKCESVSGLLQKLEHRGGNFGLLRILIWMPRSKE